MTLNIPTSHHKSRCGHICHMTTSIIAQSSHTQRQCTYLFIIIMLLLLTSVQDESILNCASTVFHIKDVSHELNHFGPKTRLPQAFQLMAKLNTYWTHSMLACLTTANCMWMLKIAHLFHSWLCILVSQHTCDMAVGRAILDLDQTLSTPASCKICSR